VAKGKSGAKPTHQLKVRDKVTGETAVVGVGWLGEGGDSVFIKLNAHVVLNEVLLRGSTLTLFASDWPVNTGRTMSEPDGGG
jgi:hypothetical protein